MLVHETEADESPGLLGGAVDVHAHFLSAGYRQALRAAGLDALDGMPGGIPGWTAGMALDLMDEAGIAMSVLSVSSPGVLLGADARAAVGLARRVNDDAAENRAGAPRPVRLLRLPFHSRTSTHRWLRSAARRRICPPAGRTADQLSRLLPRDRVRSGVPGA